MDVGRDNETVIVACASPYQNMSQHSMPMPVSTIVCLSVCQSVANKSPPGVELQNVQCTSTSTGIIEDPKDKTIRE
jgi:hypothetical protein